LKSVVLQERFIGIISNVKYSLPTDPIFHTLNLLKVTDIATVIHFQYEAFLALFACQLVVVIVKNSCQWRIQWANGLCPYHTILMTILALTFNCALLLVTLPVTGYNIVSYAWLVIIVNL